VKLLLVEASETCTERQDFISYDGVENREADNLRGLDTDSGLGCTGMTNISKHSATIVMVLRAKKRLTRPVPKGKPTG
jgi:hypothetical protein